MAAHPNSHAGEGLGLALAVVGSSTTPLVLLDGELSVLAASSSFCRAFKIDPVRVIGRKLSALGAGEWDAPQLRILLKATAAGSAVIDAYEMDLRGVYEHTRRLVLNAQKLDYGDPEHVRLLLAVVDVTDARANEKLKDDLLREKAVLLQEIQHRVANSLQIIASVLLQDARKAESEETRSHLHSAHNRVMSVAALQQILSASRLGDVELRPYFEQLCESIGASMIRDQKELTIGVSADDSAVKADISVSLGLIVTELVINALKHAFPGRRPGKIMVDYQTHGAGWTLSVSDNGVGMPKDVGSTRAGLGTSIIEALTRQLAATIEVVDTQPGTTIFVRCVEGAVDTIPKGDIGAVAV